MKLIKNFSEIHLKDISLVGGKNASLGEMFSELSSKGIKVPDGFAVTSDGYWSFLNENKLVPKLTEVLSKLNLETFDNLSEIGSKARKLLLEASLPKELSNEITASYKQLEKRSGNDSISLAVRSSATAEDLPNASFAGQQESYLNVKGEENLIASCLRCYASLFTDRAIKYRVDNGFEHMQVALSIGVQIMVRSDKASAGVMFTLDPDTGFDKVALISGAWGLGENVVQGSVNTDEFLVYKSFIGKVKRPIVSRKLGSKEKTMVYADKKISEISKPEDAIINLDTSPENQRKYILNDEEVIQLAKWAMTIQEHYERHMDIEWAKDGESNEIFIVQARPETVHSQHEKVLREEMGFTNIKLMIPFVRTVQEAKNVIAIMAENGLVRGENELQLYMMVEIPSNALLAEEFAEHFDGFSIGSNDLTQLTLGADRDSELLSEIFSPFDPAVMQLIRMAIKKAKAAGVKIGLCGQAPSDYPEYSQFLVECGIDSISFNPDALIKGIENMYQAESERLMSSQY